MRTAPVAGFRQMLQDVREMNLAAQGPDEHTFVGRTEAFESSEARLWRKAADQVLGGGAGTRPEGTHGRLLSECPVHLGT